MPDVKIRYVVDDKQLKENQKELEEIKKTVKEIQGEAKETADKGFDRMNKKAEQGNKIIGQMKGILAGAAIGAAVIKIAKDFAVLTGQILKARKEVVLLTGATGKLADEITSKIRATSSVFDKDFNEVLRTANTVSKEFKVSMTDAIDTINEGMSIGLDINGEYLETLREYSTFADKAGISTQQFNALIQKQVTEGIFSDKGIDAIKEAQLSIQEMTPATAKALRDVGVNTDKLIRDIQDGTTTYFEAIQDISKRLREETDPRKVGAILADVFRGAGEDAGKYIFTLDEVKASTIELTAEQEKYKESTDRLLGAQEKLNSELVDFAKNFKGIGTSFKTFFAEVGGDFLGWINDVGRLFRSAETDFNIFKDSLGGLSREELDDMTKKLAEAKIRIDAITRDDLRERALNIWRNQTFAIAEAYGNLTEKQDENIESTNKAVKTYSDYTKGLKDLNTEQEELNDNLDDFSELIDRVTKQFKAFDDIGVGALQKQLFPDGLEEEEVDVTGVPTKEELDQRQQDLQDFKDFTITSSIDLGNQLFDLRRSRSEAEIAMLENQMEAELHLAGSNAEARALIETKFLDKIKQARIKAAKDDRAQAIFNSIINTAVAVTKVLANPPLAFAVGIAGALKTALIAATPLPKFKKGVIGLQGPGTMTSDSIPAMLSVNESVMTGQETMDFRPTLEAIRNNRIDPALLNSFAVNPVVNIQNNNSELARLWRSRPAQMLNMDEGGFSRFIVNQGNKIKQLDSKYST